MAEKTLNTRILMKYDTLANWNNSSLLLKKGEVAVAEIPSEASASGLTPPAIGIKIGDGTKTFAQLNWIQAIAGDVQAWAKAASKPSYLANEINTSIAGKTVEGRLEDLEAASIAADVYQIAVGTGADENKWFLQKRAANASQSDPWTTVSTIDLSTILANKQDVLTFDGTYNASTNKVATESTVSNAINALDKSNISGFGAGKTLATLTETDGIIDATFQDISITLSQVSDAGDAAAKDVVTEINNTTKTSTDLPTAAAVAGYVDEKTAGLTGAMHYKGVVGAIPPASGTYVSGDVVLLENTSKEYIFDGTSWTEFGDEGSYALKTVTVSAGSGLTGGGTLEDNRTIAHATPSGASAGAHGGAANTREYVQSVTTDAFGHVTGVTTATETVTDTTYTLSQDGSDAHKIIFTPSVGNATEITIPDNNTEYTFAEGSVAGAFQVTPSGGSAQSVAIHGLAAIATTGNVNDLVQTSGDVLVLNCGDATHVI